MNPLIVNIIGAGQLGKTIGRLLVINQLAQIGGVINRSPQSTAAAIDFIGQGLACSSFELLPSADIVFIATPDDLIAATCHQLSGQNALKAGTIVVHCSGSLSSDALLAAKEKGAFIASIHPMHSFANPELSLTHYAGTFCAMEGDEQALAELKPLFESFGSKTYKIAKQKKSLYHAAGVFASNYLIALSQQAFLGLKEAGVEQEIAMQVVTNLMQNTLTNLKSSLSPEQSLTGPIQRGDLATIKQHMQAISNPAQKELYSLLGKAALVLTAHDQSRRNNIEECLSLD